MAESHTQGPWRWELNEDNKCLRLVGGKPQFDLTILRPTRWGMGGATLLVRDTAHNGMNIMHKLHKLHERRDWVQPFSGREHHARWCAGVNHPDLQLIEAAPELLDALWVCAEHNALHFGETHSTVIQARAAIAKAKGQT